MIRTFLVLFLVLILGPGFAHAQGVAVSRVDTPDADEDQTTTTQRLYLDSLVDRQRRDTDYPEWAQTLDAVQTRARELVKENDRLNSDYEKMQAQIVRLRQEIAEQKQSNAMLDSGARRMVMPPRADQQVAQLRREIKEAQADVNAKTRQYQQVSRRLSVLERQMQVSQYRERALQERTQEARKITDSVSSADDLAKDVESLRKQIEEAKARQEALNNQLEHLRKAATISDGGIETLEKDNQMLENKLAFMEQQRDQEWPKESKLIQEQRGGRSFVQNEYYKAVREKMRLEAEIKDLKDKIAAMKDPSYNRYSWKEERDKLVHATVKLDAQNKVLRDAINQLTEDRDILIDQVQKLKSRSR